MRIKGTVGIWKLFNEMHESRGIYFNKINSEKPQKRMSEPGKSLLNNYE